MAKLKAIDFKFNAKAGAPLVFRSEVTVSDTTGEFALTIPDELESVANRISRSHVMYQVAVERPRTNLRVTGPTLQACKSFIEHVAKDFLHCEVSEELVIVYGVNNQVAYVKDRDGNLYENGYACRQLFDKGEATWHGALNGSSSQGQHYQIGLVAQAFKKVTYTRESGKTVNYLRISRDCKPGATWLEKLNGFCGIALQGRDGTLPSSLREMPYSEEAAQFFYNTLLAMCKMADRIEGFFGDADLLKQAIANQSGLLLPAPSAQ